MVHIMKETDLNEFVHRKVEDKLPPAQAISVRERELSLLPSSLMVVRLVPRVSCQSGEGAFRSRIDDVDDSHCGTAFGREMEDTVSLPHVTCVITSCS